MLRLYCRWTVTLKRSQRREGLGADTGPCWGRDPQGHCVEGHEDDALERLGLQNQLDRPPWQNIIPGPISQECFHSHSEKSWLQRSYEPGGGAMVGGVGCIWLAIERGVGGGEAQFSTTSDPLTHSQAHINTKSDTHTYTFHFGPFLAIL